MIKLMIIPHSLRLWGRTLSSNGRLFVTPTQSHTKTITPTLTNLTKILAIQPQQQKRYFTTESTATQTQTSTEQSINTEPNPTETTNTTQTPEKKRGKKCFKCGERGHISSACPQIFIYEEEEVCYICKQSNHFQDSCPQNPNRIIDDGNTPPLIGKPRITPFYPNGSPIDTNIIPGPRNGLNVESFLKVLGRGCEQHVAVFPQWEDLFKKKGPELKKAGLTVQQRRWILYWVEKYRQGYLPAKVSKAGSKARKNRKKS